MKSINDVSIIGIVSENDLEKSTFNKNGKTVNCIKGSLKVRVEQRIHKDDAEPTTLEIPVSFFVSESKNDGNPHPAYAPLAEAMAKLNSIAADGIEKASWVRISGARLEMNEYYRQDGTLVSFPRINASFINIITPNADTKPEAKFTVSMCVQGGRDEIVNDELTGRYIVKGVLIKFDESADVVEFVVDNEKAIEFIKDEWTPGSTVDAVGVLNFSTTTQTEEIEVAFGDPQYKTRTINVSELVLNSGSHPKEGDFAFSDEDIANGAQKRNERLAKLKANAENKTKAAQPKGKAIDLSSLGF